MTVPEGPKPAKTLFSVMAEKFERRVRGITSRRMIIVLNSVYTNRNIFKPIEKRFN